MLAAEMNKPTTTNKYLGHDIDVLQKKLRNKKQAFAKNLIRIFWYILRLS